MASYVPLSAKATEESFGCSICLEYFQEPKLLPDCLHRFCKKCLDEIIRESPKRRFLCPLCKREYVIPEEGVDGFKTDFMISNFIESLQGEKSSCEKERQKCSEKSASTSSSPTGECHRHNERIVKALCYTCEKVPNCVKCVHSYHKDHDLFYSTNETPSQIQNGDMFTVEIIKTNQYRVFGITSTNQDKIVLTGKTHSQSSFIVVTNRKGRVLRKHEMEADSRSKWATFLYCDLLSQFRIATACQSGRVGIYEMRDGTYNIRNMGDIFDLWPSNRYISCVAVDRVNSSILVGTKLKHGRGREVLVFDNQLNYLYSLLLPEAIQYIGDMAVHSDNLLVCDKKTQRAFTLTMDRDRRQIVSCKEFRRPQSFGTYELRVFSICTANGFPYILWGEVGEGHRSCHLMRCSKEGAKILETRMVDEGAFTMCTSKASEVEKIHIATHSSGRVYIYDTIAMHQN